MILSIIISTYNRSKALAKTIESILGQQPSGRFDYELLLIDNNSADDTKDVIEKYAAGAGGKIRHFFEPVPGKCHAQNMAIREAKGEILVFTDDDVIADSHWLETIGECFLTQPCDGVGGKVLPIFPENTPDWVKNNAVKMAGGVVIYDMGEESRPFDNNTMERFIGANFAFRRKVFEECGLFRTDLGPGKGVIGEDTEFFYRLLNMNKKLYYCSKAVVWHPVDLKRLHLRHLARWHIALGRFSARREKEETKEKFVYYFGIPRYLLAGVFRDLGGMIVHCLDRIQFFKHFRGFFRKVGMIDEYRRMQENGKGEYRRA